MENGDNGRPAPADGQGAELQLPELSRLKLDPDDVLVIELPIQYTPDTARRIADQVFSVVGRRAGVMVLPPGATLQVLHGREQAQALAKAIGGNGARQG